MNLFTSTIKKNQSAGKLSKLGFDQKPPHIVKYMGSKSKILDFLIDGLDEIYEGGKVCDLFAGSATLAGALRNTVPVHSNDIQQYSSIFAKAYLTDKRMLSDHNKILTEVVAEAHEYTQILVSSYPFIDDELLHLNYISLPSFIAIEEKQKKLIYNEFSKTNWHLFTKYYSGTYWSLNQCIWIDALRKAIESIADSQYYAIALSSLMHAMSYNSQSTGHFAQYRDAKNESSKDDIIIYRKKEILPYFIKKYNDLSTKLGSDVKGHMSTSLDYAECLNTLESQTTVYADPPYAFVHYSRFYHALETLVKYDYPTVAFKGRYREDRHQSPFCKRKTVDMAFQTLFKKIIERKNSLALSYSNNGMISLERIVDIGRKEMSSYSFEVKELNYVHSTMGRRYEKNKNVKEYLLLCKP